MPKRADRRWLRRALPFLGGLVGSGLLIGCCSFSAPAYQGPASDHFDGDVFVNQDETAHGTFGKFINWQLTREQGPWEMRSDEAPGPAPPSRVEDLRVTFIGHATTLIQIDGKNILTDPVYSDRVTPVGGLGPQRHRPPGIRFEDLPPIDAVVISHNHYDHLDIPTLRRLHEAHRPRIYTGLGNRLLLEKEGIEGGKDLDWWQGDDLGGLHVRAVPAQHFSGRGLCDRDRTLWAGWVLEGRGGFVYFAGDTGMGRHFAQIRERFGSPRLAILPIGAYLPRDFMKSVHIDPAEALEAHRILGAHRSLGMHFGTFALADEGMDQAPRDLAAAIGDDAAAKEAFWVLGFGEGRDVPPT